MLVSNQDPHPHWEGGSGVSLGPAKLSLTPALPSSRWDLVCTHKNLPQLSSLILTAGMMVESLIFETLTHRSVAGETGGSRSKGMGLWAGHGGETGIPDNPGRDT